MKIRLIDQDQDGLDAIRSASITPLEKLDEVASELVPARVTRVRSLIISMEILSSEYAGWLISLNGSAKLKTDNGSTSFIVRELPGWNPVYATGLALTGVTVSEVEYRGLLRGVKFAIARDRKEIVVIGDSRLEFEQFDGRCMPTSDTPSCFGTGSVSSRPGLIRSS